MFTYIFFICIVNTAHSEGWNDVSWHNPNVITPNLAALAQDGVILDQSYVQPVCTPTRAAILTGRYPFTIGLQYDVIRPMEARGVTLKAKMLPELLKDVGYTTHAIGKWHLGFCSWDYTPTKRGFDSFYGFYLGAQNYFTHERGLTARTEDYDNFRKGATRYLDLRNNTSVDSTKDGIYSTHLFATAAKELLTSRDSSVPMFLYYSFQSVHSPLMVPDSYTEAYSHIKDTDRRTYLGMVTAMDEAVGQLVTSLKESGHYDNSVIIFTTDNGGDVNFGASNWPLRGNKHSLWEGGIRGPAFVHSPLLTNSGTVTSQLVHATDWYSTMLGIAGGNIPEKVDGFNQWEAIKGTSNPPRKRMIGNIDNTETFKASIRFKNYKMLVGDLDPIEWDSPSTNDDKPPTLWKKTSHRRSVINEARKPEISSVVDAAREPPKSEADGTFSGTTRRQFGVLWHSANHKDPKYGVLVGVDKNLESVKPEGLLRNKRVKDRKRKGNKDYITWNDLKMELALNRKVLKRLNKYLTKTTKIRLFNVKDDPEERTDLTSTNTKKLKVMMKFLSKQLRRYVPARNKKDTQKAHPSNWDDVWSPGWCKAKRL